MEKTSRFNYIKKGIVGVCAATMLTGLCAGAAFAAPGVEAGTPGTIASGGTSTTAVKAEAADAQISVTVPTSVTASVDSTGVMTFPDSTKFQITATNASWPVKVTALDVAVADGYTLKDSEASLAAAKDIIISIDGTALKAADNGVAIGGLAQTTANGNPIAVAMTGKMHSPSYADISTGVGVATLTWTLSAF